MIDHKTPLWTEAELLAATGGKVFGKITQALNGVSIDTRTLQPGDIFVAIKGDNQDGHRFVMDALKAGAGLALVSHIDEAMCAAGPVLLVPDDSLAALQRLGVAARARSHARIVAVTGSVGKTSTKEMLKIALSASGFTHASAASYNNHWGVPLTLARMPRHTAYAVFEIGMNHSGEITPLVKMVAPHVAIITNVAPVHVGNFDSVADIAAAKAEIFQGLEKGGCAILNHDNAFFASLQQQALQQGVVNIKSFGQETGSTFKAERIALHENCACVTAQIGDDKLIYKLGMPGLHMVQNSLAVLGAVREMGADLARAALALACASAPQGRGVQHRLKTSTQDLVLLDESYNANPVSMAAALALLGTLKPQGQGRRIAVLGDMLELGVHGPKLHADIAKLLSDHQISVIYAAGPLMKNLWDKLPSSQQGAYAPSSFALTEPLLKNLKAGDVVMIKGSLGSRMGPLVEAIISYHTPTSQDQQ